MDKCQVNFGTYGTESDHANICFFSYLVFIYVVACS